MTDVTMEFKIKISEDKELNLTEDEAKELYYKLNSMFGEKYNWFPITNPYPAPIEPYYTTPSIPTPDYPQYPIITCNSKGQAEVSVVSQWEEPRCSNIESITTTSEPRSVDWSYYGGHTMPAVGNNDDLDIMGYVHT